MITFKSIFYFVIINSNILPLFTGESIKEEPKDAVNKTCVLSNSNYETVLHSDCFVDKTLLIHYFLMMKWKIILITAPRRIGKTVNMEMLKTFLTNEDEKRSGICVGLYKWICNLFREEPEKLTPGCKLFKYNKLEIFNFENNAFFNQHCGKYPVIFVNFKTVTGYTFKEIFNGFKIAVSDTYKEHKYLLDSSELSDPHKEFISLFTDSENFDKITDLQLKDSLDYLSRMLYMHFSKRVMVLIDDYDTPVWSFFKGNFSKIDMENSVNYISSSMLALLKGNNYVDRILLNSRIRLVEIFSSNLNTIKHFRFLGEHPLVEYYGLTKPEVKNMLDVFNMKEMFEEVEDYYNGYASAMGKKIFNTWSTMNYMQYKRVKYYWNTTSGLENLGAILKEGLIREAVDRIMAFEPIGIEINQISIKNVTTIKHVMANNGTSDEEEIEQFLYLLLENGIFIVSHESANHVTISIPNREAYHILYAAINSQQCQSWCSGCSTK